LIENRAMLLRDERYCQAHCLDGLRSVSVARSAPANDIRRKFADRNVTTGQIILFGLTGGSSLVPRRSRCFCSACSSSSSCSARRGTRPVLLDRLAITLVTVGAAAALSVQHASKRFSWFGTVARRAPIYPAS
jgi:nickel/cobalt exporter